eukprot:1646681-Rhodomonas_salina.1
MRGGARGLHSPLLHPHPFPLLHPQTQPFTPHPFTLNSSLFTLDSPQPLNPQQHSTALNPPSSTLKPDHPSSPSLIRPEEPQRKP